MYSILISRSKCLMLAALIGSALSACASLPSASGHHASAQPLQRMTPAPAPHPNDDLLAQLINGEFALADNHLDDAAQAYARAAELSDDTAIAETATRIALAGKQWDQAKHSLQRWQVLRPAGDSGTHLAQAMIAMHEDRIEDAYQNLLHLARLPESKGWREIAQVLLSDEDHEKAGAMAERLALPELLGDKPEVWVATSQMAQHLQRKALAQTLAEGAIRKFKTAEAYTWGAQMRIGAGDKAGARALFADALQRDPKNLRLRVAYARLLGDLGANADAAQMLAAGEQDDYTYAARAAYAARAGDNKLVEPLYTELKALPEPRPAARVQLLGQIAELLERKTEALGWYQKIEASDEHWFDAQVRSAVLLDGTGKTREGLDLIHELQARAADDSKQLGEVYMIEAELLNRRQRGAEAIAVYDRGLKALPNDTRLLYARALLNDDLGHVDAAVGDLRRVIELKPDDADALNALGYTLVDSNDKSGSEALALIQKALALKPGEAAIIDSLGWAQYRLGNLDEAVKQLKAAYDKRPDAEIAAHLGEVLWVAGQKDAAREVWEQGRKKDEKNKVLLDTMKRLAS